MTEIHPIPETVHQASNPLVRAQQIVEHAWTEVKASKAKALPIALAGSLFFSAACGISENSSSGKTVTENRGARVTATATAKPTEVPMIPVSVEPGKFNKDFSDINFAVHELVRPEALKANPGIVDSSLMFYPDKLAKQSEAGLFVEQIKPSSKPNMMKGAEIGWRRLIFRPDKDKQGSTTVYVTYDDKGKVIDRTLYIDLTTDGKYRPGFEGYSPNAISDEDLPGVAEKFFNLPENTKLEWKKSVYGDGQITGEANAGGKRYFVVTGRSGGTIFSISG